MEMGDHWRCKLMKLPCSAALLEPFRIFTTALLGLILPLSFLLLAHLSCLSYLYPTTAPFSSPYPSSDFAFPLFLHANPIILYTAVSVTSVSALVNGLTGEIGHLVSDSPAGALYPPRLCIAWIVLCTLQVCVGLGIEGTIGVGVDGVSFGVERSLVSRALFLFGLHETTLLWTRAVVKPVVDDTVYGGPTGRSWVDRVVGTASLGGLWWWRMRDEVEALVVVTEAKKELLMGIGVTDFVGWWLYYLTVTIGMVKVVKVLMWVSAVLLCTRVRRSSLDNNSEVEDKV